MRELVESIAKALVDNPDHMSVTEMERRGRGLPDRLFWPEPLGYMPQPLPEENNPPIPDPEVSGLGVFSYFESKELPHFSQYMPCGFLTEPSSVYSNGEEGMNAYRLWKEFPPQRFVFLLSNCVRPGLKLIWGQILKKTGVYPPENPQAPFRRVL